MTSAKGFDVTRSVIQVDPFRNMYTMDWETGDADHDQVKSLGLGFPDRQQFMLSDTGAIGSLLIMNIMIMSLVLEVICMQNMSYACYSPHNG